MEYGLIGAKLGHSYSPAIHRQLGGYRYELCPLPTEQEARAFLKARQFSGINVTIPYKQLVIPYCDEIDPMAQAIGAVNTVVNRDGKLYGYNTDFAGFAYLLAAHGVSLSGKTVMILGTGGTCKTVTAVARQQGAKQILTVSRRAAEGCLTYEQAARRTDVQVVINTTPAGMYPNPGTCLLDLSALHSCEAVFDVVYNPFKTELIQRAEEQGIPAFCGFEMLVAQAVFAAQHFLQTEFPPEKIRDIHRQLKAQIANVSLVGMPGCGKSSIGRQLAKRLNKRFVDLDEEIEQLAGKTIPQIFAQEGEAAFRRLEQQVADTFSAQNGQVLSCGGGIIKTPGNARMLHRNGPVLFIDRPVEALAVGGGRPLSSSREALRTMETERRPLYLAAADAAVENCGGFEQAVQSAMEEFYETFDS